jgi:hypothetical protein
LVIKYLKELKDDGLIKRISKGKREEYQPTDIGISIVKKFKDEIQSFPEKVMKNVIWNVKIENLNSEFPERIRRKFYKFILHFECEEIFHKDLLNFICTINEDKFREFIEDEQNEFTWLLTDDDKVLGNLDTAYFKVNNLKIECIPCKRKVNPLVKILHILSEGNINCSQEGIYIDSDTIKYSYKCDKFIDHLIHVKETGYHEKFKVSYDIINLIEIEGNYFFISLPRPTMGFTLSVDYTSTDIEQVVIREFLDVPYNIQSYGRNIILTTAPSKIIDRGKNLTVLYYR